MVELEKKIKILDELVDIYSFRYEDNCVDYEPNEMERMMLYDFGIQLLEDLEES